MYSAVQRSSRQRGRLRSSLLASSVLDFWMLTERPCTMFFSIVQDQLPR